MSVEESDPVRADEFGPVRVDEFGPTDAGEDVVQEAEDLKHVPAPVLPSKAEVESHNVSRLPFRSWCSACVRGRGPSLGHHKLDANIKEAEQIPTVSVDHGFLGQPEGRAHHTLPVLIVRDRKSNGIWSRPVPAKDVTHPYLAGALMTDLDFMGYKRVIHKSHQPSIVALCDAVKNGWHGEIVPEASPKGESKSNGEVEQSKLCTDLRAPSKTSWNNNLEPRWSLEVRCWLGWSSIVPIFSNSSTRVSVKPT